MATSGSALANWISVRKSAGQSDFGLLVASALPDAAFELPALSHGNGSSGSPFSGGFEAMMMIFEDFPGKAPPIPHAGVFALENVVSIRPETKRAVETAP